MIDITNISDMTDEQLKELLSKASEEIGNLEAERDSFKEENENLNQNVKNLTEELSKTKKLNFTLARTLDTGSKSESAEDILSKMFDRKE